MLASLVRVTLARGIVASFPVVINSFDFGYLPADKLGDFVSTCDRYLAVLPRACRPGHELVPAGPQGEHTDHAEADPEDDSSVRCAPRLGWPP